MHLPSPQLWKMHLPYRVEGAVSRSYFPLIETILALSKPGGETTVVLSLSQAFEARTGITTSGAVAAEHGFNLEVLHTQGVIFVVTLREGTREGWKP
jgi:hypothetical protein